MLIDAAGSAEAGLGIDDPQMPRPHTRPGKGVPAGMLLPLAAHSSLHLNDQDCSLLYTGQVDSAPLKLN